MTESNHYPLIMQAMNEAVWAILPAKLAEIKMFLQLKASGIGLSADELEAMKIQAASRPQQRWNGAVAVIPVFGTITQRANLMSEMSGGTSTEVLGNQISQAVSDPNVSAIVLDVDSPGGTVKGVPELASLIRSARNSKPIVASSNGLMASAAYYIASAATEIVGTPSSETGSIGVLAIHQDISGALEKEGVKKTIISAGKFKAEASPFEPLNDDARAAIQSYVDEAFDNFIADVAAGRGVNASQVRSGFGEGRVLTAPNALAAGMIDRIETLNETIQRVAANPSKIGMRAELEPLPIVADEPQGVSDLLARRRAALG